MFSIIAGSGQIETASGEPAANLLINVELFFVEGETWEPMTEFETARNGLFKFSFRTDLFSDALTAPLLRLVEQRDQTTLAVMPEMQFSRDTLAFEYGTIRLGGAGAGGADVEKLKQQLDEANKTIEELEAKLEKASLDEVTSAEIRRLKLELIGKETELKEATSQLDVAKTRFNSVDEERATLQLELDQIRNADTASPLITDLAGSVAKSLGDARKSESAQGFKLADAQVTLKGYLADGGARFKPLDAAEIVRANAAGASEISFRLSPTGDAAGSGPKMPDLVGLTPSSARRILRPLGQPMQVVEARGKPAGAIIKQVPKAGAALDPDATIRLVVAIGEEESA